MIVRFCIVLGAGAMAAAPAAAADAPSASDLAAAFGKREFVQDISLSPDGKRVAFITPGPAHSTIAATLDVAGGEMQGVARADGEPLNLVSCGWASNSRIVCKQYGIDLDDSGTELPFTRTVAINADGSKPLYLARKLNGDAARISQFDGTVIDWLSGDQPTVLMTRDYVPETTNGLVVSNKDGLGVDRVDTLTGKGVEVEAPTRGADEFITDGQGHVRIIGIAESSSGLLTGAHTYLYRTGDGGPWKPFSKWTSGADVFNPIAVDGTRNVVFASKPLNGRAALYSVALDGSMKADLVSSNAAVDVDSVVTVGRHGRVIGAVYVAERRETAYFDPDYKALAANLARALPNTPLIQIVDASADEKHLLVFASSDTDPGRYYILDRDTKRMAELMAARPELANVTLAPVKAVSYKAADGTSIPAYLTLPPSGPGKGLPAIVMPHGGPASRDEWGFDWLAQYFAQRGYAVLQPEFRGSSGYGDAWFAKNGFQSWRLAIGDVCDAGRWLEKEGIAAPSKLAIVGWSYGGYAALQSNVLDADLFKAVVAIAPVTDFALTRAEANGFTDHRLVAQTVGSGTIVQEGSPDRHAAAFKAPVLMFHGDRDLNVGVEQSRAMDAALRHAGKQSTLVVFPHLDHQLGDSDARAKMLAQSDEFLRHALGL